MNSKGEFNRCHIPRLTLEAEDLWTRKEEEETPGLEVDSEYQKIKLAERTETARNGLRTEASTKTATKRGPNIGLDKIRRTKKLKSSVMREDWGLEPAPREGGLEITRLERPVSRYQLRLEWDPWRLGGYLWNIYPTLR